VRADAVMAAELRSEPGPLASNCGIRMINDPKCKAINCLPTSKLELEVAVLASRAR
jgi:hypothetical protein